ncbi:NAC domain-containing protein 82-like isoform X2 [Mangifera indica]|uniref:NAC domain-containing protein 82-like isoform X2 n=1 Tax=Mangifera indica TaxID=29780 RepID=UPI001CF9F7DE|nr:NAC domain-containing protein 82-like isoform X2 [Mangifera indica]
MGKTSLLPGFRFHPTDVELVMYYLKRKIMGRKFHSDAITEVDIYKCTPWDLPAKSSLRTGDLMWYFLSPRERKYGSGARINRATEFGFWKITGKDRPVNYNNKTVGMIKTLVFHRGKAPKGDRTDWVVHEYRIEDKDLENQGVIQDSYVLCKVFQKEGLGPRNGAQYGAPFKAEHWDDDEDVDCMELVSAGANSIPVSNLISPVPASLSCLSDAISSVSNVPLITSKNNGVASRVDTVLPVDDVETMLGIFREDSTSLPNENGQNEICGHQLEVLPHSDGNNIFSGNDIFSGLGDLDYDCRLSEGAMSYYECDYLNQSFLGDNTSFLELHDLDTPLDGPVNAGIF